MAKSAKENKLLGNIQNRVVAPKIQEIKTGENTNVRSDNDNNTFKNIPIDLIDFDENNEYLNGYEDVEALTNSVSEIGFSGAISVYKKEDGRYLCSSGHSRLFAAKNNGITEIPAQITEEPSDEDKMQRLVLMNTQRKKRPTYTARNIVAYEKILRSKGFKGDINGELGKVFGYSKKQIIRYKNLLSLDSRFQEFGKRENFPFSILIDLLSQATAEDQDKFYKMLEEYYTVNTEDEITGKELEALFEKTKQADLIPIIEHSSNKKEEKKQSAHKYITKVFKLSQEEFELDVPEKKREEYLNHIDSIIDKLNYIKENI